MPAPDFNQDVTMAGIPAQRAWRSRLLQPTGEKRLNRIHPEMTVYNLWRNFKNWQQE
jgi:hypothetical protein